MKNISYPETINKDTIVDDTMHQIEAIDVNVANIDERIYNCNKVLTMLRMLEAAVGRKTAAMADKEFTTTWTLRCTEKRKQQIEFNKELELRYGNK
jgi:hypothetical protein